MTSVALDEIVNVTVQDVYSAVAMFLDEGRTAPFVAVDLNLTGAAVFYQLAGKGGAFEADEHFLAPVLGPKALGEFYGIRFRNAVPGKPAQLTAEGIDQAVIAAAGGLGSVAAPPYIVDGLGNVTAVSVGSMTQLFDSGHIAAPQPSFDVQLTNIASYTDLIVELSLRSDVAAKFDAAKVQFLGDAGNNYGYITALLLAGVETIAQAALATQIQTPALIPGAAATANCFGSLLLELPDFANTVTAKEVRLRGSGTGSIAAGDQGSFTGSGFHNGTQRLSRVTVSPLNGANWAANSRCVIWAIT